MTRTGGGRLRPAWGRARVPGHLLGERIPPAPQGRPDQMSPVRAAAPIPRWIPTVGPGWAALPNFQAEKGLAGLDEHQVRRYPS